MFLLCPNPKLRFSLLLMFWRSWEEIAVRFPPILFHLLFVLIYIRWNPAHWFTTLVPYNCYWTENIAENLLNRKKLFWALCWQFILEPREHLNFFPFRINSKNGFATPLCQMKNVILVLNPLFTLSCLLLIKLKHLFRRLEFWEVCIHKQAGPHQTVPCGPLKWSVRVYPRLRALSADAQMNAGKKPRTRVWSHCWNPWDRSFKR